MEEPVLQLVLRPVLRSFSEGGSFLDLRSLPDLRSLDEVGDEVGSEGG